MMNFWTCDNLLDDTCHDVSNILTSVSSNEWNTLKERYGDVVMEPLLASNKTSSSSTSSSTVPCTISSHVISALPLTALGSEISELYYFDFQAQKDRSTREEIFLSNNES
jgi:hypothetical protein